MDQLHYSLCPHCSKTVYESICISRVWKIQRFFLSVAHAPWSPHWSFKVSHWHLFQICAEVFFMFITSCVTRHVSGIAFLAFECETNCWAHANKYVPGHLNKKLHLCRAIGAGHVGAAILLQMWVVNAIYVSVKEIHIRVYFEFVMGLSVLIKSTSFLYWSVWMPQGYRN